MRAFIEGNPKKVRAFMEDPREKWERISDELHREDELIVVANYCQPKWDRMLSLYKSMYPDEFEIYFEGSENECEYFKEESIIGCQFEERWDWFIEWLLRKHHDLYGNFYMDDFIKLAKKMGFVEGKEPEAIQQSMF